MKYHSQCSAYNKVNRHARNKVKHKTHLNRKVSNKRHINDSNVGISNGELKRAFINMLKNLVQNMDKKYEQMENFSKKLEL